jgi:polysaccharide export outer membrane protein
MRRRSNKPAEKLKRTPRMVYNLARQAEILKVFNWIPRIFIQTFALGLGFSPLANCTLDTTVSTAPAPVEQLGPLYRIGPNDQLSIFVYGSPNLSVSQLPVRPDGRISIPLVPNIIAENKTTTELEKEITQDLEKYMKPPVSVTVMVNTFHGPLNSQIYVIGNSGKPLALSYETGLDLLSVMTDVGGLADYADGNGAYIDRNTDGHETKLPVKIGALLNHGDLSQNIAMSPGDVVVIPSTWF